MYTYIPSPLSLLTRTPHATLEVARHQLAEPTVLSSSFLLGIHSTREAIPVSAPLPPAPPSCPYCVHKFVLYVCLSGIPTLEIGSAVSFFLDSMYSGALQ